MNVSATFNTITADDWRRSIARARVEGNTLLMQIRARCAPTTSGRPPQRMGDALGVARVYSPAGPITFTGAGSSAPTEERAHGRAEAGAGGKLSSGSPERAALALGLADCNGVEKCREALTRQESPVPVTSLSNREGDCPPLEFISPITAPATTPGEPRENAADACPAAVAESPFTSALNQ